MFLLYKMTTFEQVEVEPLTLFPMGVGHECFFEEQSIIMSLQTYICSYKLIDNSLSSIFKAIIALVLRFVIEN